MIAETPSGMPVGLDPRRQGLLELVVGYFTRGVAPEAEILVKIRQLARGMSTGDVLELVELGRSVARSREKTAARGRRR